MAGSFLTSLIAAHAQLLSVRVVPTHPCLRQAHLITIRRARRPRVLTRLRPGRQRTGIETTRAPRLPAKPSRS